MGRSPNRQIAFRKQVDAFKRVLPGLERGSVEALHRTRVASRRLREWLPLLETDPETARNTKNRLRRVTRQLGPVRELDVLAAVIDDLGRQGRYPALALEYIGLAVAQERAAARERLSTRLSKEKLERLAEKLDQAAQSLNSAAVPNPPQRPVTPRKNWNWAMESRLARRAAGVRSTIEAAGALYAPEPLHSIRIALKKLRYSVELSGETGLRPRVKATVAALKAAQDLLGHLHDLQILLAWIRHVQASVPPGSVAVREALGVLAQAIEDDCRQLHAGYMRDRATLIAIADRLSAKDAAPLSRLSGNATETARTGRTDGAR